MVEIRVPARPARRVLLPGTVVGVLVLSGCGGGSGPSQEELEAMVAPEDTSGDVANAPDPSELRFDPESLTCEPSANSSVDGEWETSAPREAVAPGNETELGLRDSEATNEVEVTAHIHTPSDNRFEAGTTVGDDEWAPLVFPADFPDTPELVTTEGVYTVVWSADGEFVSCDGFRVG